MCGLGPLLAGGQVSEWRGDPPSLPDMTERLRPFDVVRFRNGLDDHGVAAGARGVVLDVHESPSLAYEVEVTDDDGRTVFFGAVDPDYVERETPDS